MSGFRDRSVPGESLHVSIKDPTSGDPVLCTSHQAFQRILISIGEAQAADLQFTVHEYCLNPFSSLHSVQVTGSSQGNNLFVPKAKPVPKPKLPFGLKMPTRPRQRKPAGPSQLKRRKVDASTSAAHDVKNFVEHFGTDHLDDSLLLADSGSDPSFGSESSCESASSSESETLRGPNSESECDDVDAHEQVHLTAQEAAEQAQIQEVLGSHQARVEERGEFFCVRDVPSADAHLPEQEPPTGKSFCNARLGLVDVGLQTSGRLARCRHCLEKIEKNSCRFQFAWSRVKFASWLHDRCVLGHLEQEGSDHVKALVFLQEKLNDGENGVTYLAPEVQDAIKKLMKDIRAKAA